MQFGKRINKNGRLTPIRRDIGLMPAVAILIGRGPNGIASQCETSPSAMESHINALSRAYAPTVNSAFQLLCLIVNRLTELRSTS